MTDAEVGLYFRLLCAQWSRGSVPNDDLELLRFSGGSAGDEPMIICGITGDRATASVSQASLDRIKRKFEIGEDGRLRNARLELERDKQAAFNQAQTEKISKRWAKPKKSGNTPVSPAGNTPVDTPVIPSVSVSGSVSNKEGPPVPQSGFAEIPSWEEFWTYCQQIGMHGEAFARDKFNAAAQENWSKQRNWRPYVARVKAWWEEKGRPMGQPAAQPQTAAPVSPYVLMTMLKDRQKELDGMVEEAEIYDDIRRDPKLKARRIELRKQIKDLKAQLEKAAGLVSA